MVKFFDKINIDWLSKRRMFIVVSVMLMLLGFVSATVRQLVPGGSDAFNLGVDFKGGTVVTAKFKQRPSEEAIRDALRQQGVADAIVQADNTKTDEMLIRVPQLQGTTPATQIPNANQNANGNSNSNNTPAAQTASANSNAGDNLNANANTKVAAEAAQVDPGGARVRQALNNFGTEYRVDELPNAPNGYAIVGTDAVGPVAGEQLRNQAIAVTLAALVGILLYIASRFEWTYGASAVIAVFHDVLVTLGVFSLFQWEINLTVIAALLTLVGFSVNDTIVVFDRIRENLKLHPRDSLYDITNLSINQTLSRTIITSGLVFLSAVALVVFGGEVLRPFSLALLIGISFGTFSSIAIASPIMVWWQQRLGSRGTIVGGKSARSTLASNAKAGAPRSGRLRTPNASQR